MRSKLQHRAARRSPRAAQAQRRGTAAVELALVAPVLLVLVMGGIEFGRAMLVQQVLTNASRVGARAAVLPNGTQSGVISAAQSYASGAGVAGVTVNVSPSPSAATVGESVTVEVSIAFDDTTWLPSDWFMGGLTLQATSVMYKEGYE